MLCELWPLRNCAMALTWVGTVTSKVSPALGPEPMTRWDRAVEAMAATEATGPNAWTSVVR